MHFSDLLICKEPRCVGSKKKKKLETNLNGFFSIHWIERSNGVETDLAGYYNGIIRKHGHKSDSSAFLGQDVRRGATVVRGPTKIGRRS